MKRRFVLILVFLTTCSLVSAAAETEKQVKFPNIQLTALDGQSSTNIEAFRGRPLLVTMWASWCGPCRTELPELEQLYGELAGSGFTVITISVDNSPVLAQRFMERTQLHLPAFTVDRMELRKLGINSVPTSILLDREGNAVKIYSGYYPKMRDQIRELVVAMNPRPESRLDGDDATQ